MNGTVSTEVRDYVAQVRAALADLPLEDVEEFTTGMEADLTERLAEPGDGTLRDRLGEPEVYAAELRSAAGLPPRAALVPVEEACGAAPFGPVVGPELRCLEAMPWLGDLRPLWWAVRGFILLAGSPMWMHRWTGIGLLWGARRRSSRSFSGCSCANGSRPVGGSRRFGSSSTSSAVLLLPFAFVAARRSRSISQ